MRPSAKHLEQVVVALPTMVPPLSAVRSTLIMASIESLREEGLYDRYYELLPERARHHVIDAVAGAWVPLAAALDHYAACDGLGLAASSQVALGGRTFVRIKGTLLGTAVRMATSGAGVTPWTVIGIVDRFWSRAYQGSAIGIRKVGPKDAIAEIAGMPLASSTYFRNAYRGLCMALLELMCSRCIMLEIAEGATGSSRRFRAQWA